MLLTTTDIVLPLAVLQKNSMFLSGMLKCIVYEMSIIFNGLVMKFVIIRVVLQHESQYKPSSCIFSGC